MNTVEPGVPGGLFRQTMTVIGKILPIFALGVVVTTLLEIASPDTGFLAMAIFVVSTLLDTAIAYAACHYMLFRDSRAVLAGLLSGSASLFIAAWALPYLLAGLFFVIVAMATGDNLNAILIVATGTFLLIMFLVARYGTFYPALIDGGNLSLRAAARRVRTGKVFWRLLGVVLLGGGLITMAILVAPTSLSGEPLIGFLSGAPLHFMTGCVGLCMSVATAVILCNAYRGLYADRAS